MIGDRVFAKMKQLGGELVALHEERMKQAFSRSDDGKLSVTVSFTIAPGKVAGQYDVDATISYTMEKVKEKISANVSENQMDLPLSGDKTYKLTK
jgi:hypothetical protein